MSEKVWFLTGASRGFGREWTIAALERGEFGDAEYEEYARPIREQFESQSSAYYSTARMWDDGIIDPADTRTVLGLALAAAANAPA